MASVLNRLGIWAVALILGLVFGAAGSLAHASSWGPVPLGLVLGIVGAAGLIVSMRLLFGDRWAALAAGAGVMLATYFFSLPSPGGSVLFTEQHEVLALIWMGATPVVTAVVLAWPDLRPYRRPVGGEPN